MPVIDWNDHRFIVRVHYKSKRPLACIEIEDNCPGMEEPTRRRNLGSFYTTKPVGIGTGLGLSVFHFILTENYAGELRIKSEPGKGACFSIRLPLAIKETGYEDHSHTR